jgi:hypothetical protein
MIDQTLHGYRDGHRLLAASPGVRPEERRGIGRNSDLSGPVPSGYHWGRYWTGYPVGDRWAFAATWPDHAAPRRGAVWTHTLLIDLANLEQVDLAILAELHRFPVRGEEVLYEQELVVPEPNGGPEGTIPDRALVASTFGPGRRPGVRLGVHCAEADVCALWRWMWRSARAKFAFCTTAFGPMDLGERQYDLLWAPAEARGGFAGRVVRWVDQETDDAWVDELVRAGGPHLWLNQGRARGLPTPAMNDLWLFPRLFQLEDGASERLTAARGWADLLERLWPDSSVCPDVWSRALKALMAGQHQGALSPKPWWELDDLLRRPQLAGGAVRWPSLGPVVQREFQRRLGLAAPPSSLMLAIERLGVTGDALRGAREAMQEASESGAALLVAHALGVAGSGLIHAVLDACSSDVRLEACKGAFGDVRVWEAARELKDWVLLAHCHWVVGNPALVDVLPQCDDRQVALLVESAPTFDLQHALTMPGKWDIEVMVATLSRGGEVRRNAVEALLLWDPQRFRVLVEGHAALVRECLGDRGAEVLTPTLLDGLGARLVLSVLCPPVVPKGWGDRLALQLARGLIADDDDVNLAWLDGELAERISSWSAAKVTEVAGGADSLGRSLPSLLSGLGVRAHKVSNLWLCALHCAPLESLLAARDAVLDLQPWGADIGMAVLGAVRRTPHLDLMAWVVCAFPVVHKQLLEGKANDSWMEVGFSLLGWDKAGRLRHWLVELWLDQGWPASGLGELVGGDVVLDRKIRELLRESGEGRELLARL